MAGISEYEKIKRLVKLLIKHKAERLSDRGKSESLQTEDALSALEDEQPRFDEGKRSDDYEKQSADEDKRPANEECKKIVAENTLYHRSKGLSDGELSDADFPDSEMSEIADWSRTSSENREVFEKMDSEGVNTGDIEFYDGLDIEEEFLKFKTILSKNRRGTAIRRLSAVAAAVVVILSVGVFLKTQRKQMSSQNALAGITEKMDKRVKLMLSSGEAISLSDNIDSAKVKVDNIRFVGNTNTLRYSMDNAGDTDKVAQTNRFNTIAVPRGAEYNFYLADGTHVYLNSETTIKFPVSFTGKQRRINITGEAYLVVAKNKEKPFVVETGDADIVVTGTVFNISAYPEDDNVRTTLVEGGVDIYYGIDKDKKVSIVPNQQAEINKRSNDVVVSTVDTDIYTSWVGSEFCFEDERIEDIMTVLQRWYDIEVFYENSAVKEMMYSGRIRKDNSVDEVIKILSEMPELTVIKNKKTVILK